MNLNDVTRQEFGAFLQTVGEEMATHDLSFGAALDGHSDMNMLPRLAARLEPPGFKADVRAGQLLSLDLEDTLWLLGNQE